MSVSTVIQYVSINYDRMESVAIKHPIAYVIHRTTLNTLDATLFLIRNMIKNF